MMRAALLALLLLAAPSVWAQAPPSPAPAMSAPWVGAYSPEAVDAIERAPIGGVVEIRVPSGDCNTCTCGVQRVSETEVRMGGCTCTAMACLQPAHRFKPEERKEPK